MKPLAVVLLVLVGCAAPPWARCPPAQKAAACPESSMEEFDFSEEARIASQKTGCP